MANGQQSWGVTEVIVRYVSGNDTWEISLDPRNIDTLVFNWQRFKTVNEVVGAPLPAGNHVLPNGSLLKGEGTPAEIAARMGLNGPPRRIGKRAEGTGDDPICLHNVDCTWWCMDETHSHD